MRSWFMPSRGKQYENKAKPNEELHQVPIYREKGSLLRRKKLRRDLGFILSFAFFETRVVRKIFPPGSRKFRTDE
jgi:hypothetical protein